MDILAIIISSTICFAVPLLLVALAGVFSERSGTVNIALEGIMIVGALFSTLVLKGLNTIDFFKSNSGLGMLIAVLVAGVTGAIFSALLAFASVNLKADQTIGGTALNMFAPAFAIVLTWAIQGQGQTTIYLPEWVQISGDSLNISEAVQNSFFGIILFRSLYLTTPIAILVFIIANMLLYKTKFGLRLRSCGEHPHAADSVGIDVYKIRYAGVLISGFLAGIGGLSFIIAVGSGFTADVAGYGFLALAVMIFGNWKPIRILFASLLFAFFKTIAGMSSSIGFLPTFENLKEAHYLYLMIPYIITLVVLSFTSKKTKAPKALGIPYDKSLR